jgi:hypothetical protein
LISIGGAENVIGHGADAGWEQAQDLGSRARISSSLPVARSRAERASFVLPSSKCFQRAFLSQKLPIQLPRPFPYVSGLSHPARFSAPEYPLLRQAHFHSQQKKEVERLSILASANAQTPVFSPCIKVLFEVAFNIVSSPLNSHVCPFCEDIDRLKVKSWRLGITQAL